MKKLKNIWYEVDRIQRELRQQRVTVGEGASFFFNATMEFSDAVVEFLDKLEAALSGGPGNLEAFAKSYGWNDFEIKIPESVVVANAESSPALPDQKPKTRTSRRATRSKAKAKTEA